MAAPLLYTQDGAVVTITLNRPEKHNAVNAAMRQAMLDAWERFENDERAAVAILAAAGDRSFCAGRDMSEPATHGHREFLPILGDGVQVSKTVIAAVEGNALGGGWFLAQMCDLVVASETARFGLPEVKVGRVPVWASQLISLIGQKHALEVALTGAPVSARRAYEMGLVNRVVAPGQALHAAGELARQIAANAPLALGASKRMLYDAIGMSRDAALAHAFEIAEPVLASPDAAEGLAAFREKRAPVWRKRGA
jgi:enoyl-CoA hydratase